MRESLDERPRISPYLGAHTEREPCVTVNGAGIVQSFIVRYK